MKVESIKRKLLMKYPLFGSIVANSNFIAELEVGTVETDGKNIYYNPNFIESITNNQQIFSFAHVICHIAFNHIFRSEGKDKNLWKIATDSVINAFLKQDGLPLVEGSVDIPEAIHYDSEEMYKKMFEEKKQQQQQNEQGSGQNQQDSQQQSSFGSESLQGQDKQSQEQSDGKSGEESQEKEKQQTVGHDVHSMWDKAIEKKHQEEQQNLEEIQNKKQEKKKNEVIKKLSELSEKETFKQNKIERKKQLEELRKALASQSYGFGKTTNSERNIIEIETSTPLIDWRRLLEETVKYDMDWSYQNAEIEDGVVTAYLEKIPSSETEIVMDTSGSINATLLRNFLRECKNILQTSKVKVGCFDTKFYGFTEMKEVSDIDNFPLYGGGGTNFDVAVNAFTRRADNKIIFTDGAAKMPSTSIDAIWIVFGGKKINPPGGKVIYINDEQLKRLYNYQMTNERKLG